MSTEPDWTAALADAQRLVDESTVVVQPDRAAVNLARCLLAAHEERERQGLSQDTIDALKREGYVIAHGSRVLDEAAIRAEERAATERDCIKRLEDAAEANRREAEARGSHLHRTYADAYANAASLIRLPDPQAPRPAPTETAAPRRSLGMRVDGIDRGRDQPTEGTAAAEPSSEPAPDEMASVPDEVHERGWQWRPVGDSAFAPPFGTVRVCRGCGCLVAGGPTACTRCANEPTPASPEPAKVRARTLTYGDGTTWPWWVHVEPLHDTHRTPDADQRYQLTLSDDAMDVAHGKDWPGEPGDTSDGFSHAECHAAALRLHTAITAPFAARIEALEAENARLREESATRLASNAVLAETIVADDIEIEQLRAAQSAPSGLAVEAFADLFDGNCLVCHGEGAVNGDDGDDCDACGGDGVRKVEDTVREVLRRLSASAPSGLDGIEDDPERWAALHEPLLNAAFAWRDEQTRDHSKRALTTVPWMVLYRECREFRNKVVAAATRELRAERDRMREERDDERRERCSERAADDHRGVLRNVRAANMRAAVALYGEDEARRLFPASTPDTSGPQEPTGGYPIRYAGKVVARLTSDGVRGRETHDPTLDATSPTEETTDAD